MLDAPVGFTGAETLPPVMLADVPVVGAACVDCVDVDVSSVDVVEVEAVDELVTPVTDTGAEITGLFRLDVVTSTVCDAVPSFSVPTVILVPEVGLVVVEADDVCAAH